MTDSVTWSSLILDNGNVCFNAWTSRYSHVCKVIATQNAVRVYQQSREPYFTNYVLSLSVLISILSTWGLGADFLRPSRWGRTWECPPWLSRFWLRRHRRWWRAESLNRKKIISIMKNQSWKMFFKMFSKELQLMWMQAIKV